MHAGESVSLTDDEQRAVLAFAHQAVDGRVPVIAHVSDAGTAIAAARAPARRRWAPPRSSPPRPITGRRRPRMMIEHFAQIGAAVTIPFFVYNSPEEMPGTRITAELASS